MYSFFPLSDPSSRHRSGWARRRRFWGSTPTVAAALTSAALALTLSACQANPGEAPTVEDPSATTQSQPPKPVDESLREITVGVDRFTSNLNPHLVGNRNPVVAAVADLTLPSVYMQGTEGEGLNNDLISSIVPNDEEFPTEVTYTLNPEAQWSDGTPITISDFQYLREAILKEPLAESKGLYRHVTSIKPGDKEKSVKVTFDRPLEGWKRLFMHLLPSHIYRAEGRTFTTMMNEGSVASAGQYSVKSVDEGRGLLELQRNDRYWGKKAAKTDIIRFTTVPNESTGAQMMRTQQIQMYMTHTSATTDLAMEQLPYAQVRKTTREVQLNLQLNQASPLLQNRTLRRRLLGAIDSEKIARIVSGDPDVGSPHWNVKPKTEKEVPDNLVTDDRPEGIVIGAVNDDQMAVDAARSVVDQLLQAGIPAVVRTGEASDILGTSVQQGTVDGVVTWQRSPQLIADYVQQYGCTYTSQTADARTPKNNSSSEAQGEVGKNAGEGSSTSANEGADGSADEKSGAEARLDNTPSGGNLSGTCDQELEQRLTKLREGETELEDERTRVDDRIAELSTVLPILSDRFTVVASNRLSGPTQKLQDWPLDDSSSLLVSAPLWTLMPMEELDRSAADNARKED
ncbi:ABC transporter family substrate-binding protein [Corynebacterium macclintockiae]|uniref:ABC transporter family substrate-binding protein n=1 Tax=Corynebacterium macclintockiae TaxID=2913501 RepID=UPI003EBCA7E6